MVQLMQVVVALQIATVHLHHHHGNCDKDSGGDEADGVRVWQGLRLTSVMVMRMMVAVTRCTDDDGAKKHMYAGLIRMSSAWSGVGDTVCIKLCS